MGQLYPYPQPERSSELSIDRDPQWQELLAQYDHVSAAAWIAWDALFAAYQPALKGQGPPTQSLLDAYHRASALRLEAEKALVQFIRERTDDDERAQAMAMARMTLRRSAGGF